MRFGVRTDDGRVRQNNQDAYGRRGGLFMVADGMGGHRGGEVASRLAVEHILAAAVGADPLVEFRAGVTAANAAILQYASAHQDCEGMGTTIAALVFGSERALVANIGDSRVYRRRAGVLTLLTHDHTYVEELIREGSLSAKEARSHPQRSLLTRALGTTEAARAEYAEIEAEPGDIFLLCTDGLTSMVTDEEINEALAERDPEAAAAFLVDLANQNGGNDNITVMVVKHDG